MLTSLRIVLSWMTILPVGPRDAPDPAVAARSLRFMPVVGLVCGAIAAAAGALISAAGATPLVAGAVVVVTLVVLTRGMHVDALADTTDALGSGAEAGRAVEIMRSGPVGPMGAAALVLVLVTEVAAVAALAGAGAWIAVVAAAVVSRCLALPQMHPSIPPASTTGFGVVAAGSQSTRAVAVTTAIAALSGAGLALGWPGAGWGVPAVAAWWTPVVSAVCAVAGIAAAVLFARHTTRRLGGVTGDVHGATIEAGFAVALVVAALLV